MSDKSELAAVWLVGRSVSFDIFVQYNFIHKNYNQTNGNNNNTNKNYNFHSDDSRLEVKWMNIDANSLSHCVVFFT